VPVGFAVTVKGRGEVGKNIRETVKGSFTAYLHLTPDIGPEWAPVVAMDADFRWDQRPYITILGVPITIGGLLEPKLREELGKLGTQVEVKLKELDIRGEAEKAWKKSQNPFQVTEVPPVWVHFQPAEVFFAGISIKEGILRTHLGLTGKTATYIGSKPSIPPLSTLPPLKRSHQTEPNLNIQIPIVVAYSILEQQGEQALRKGEKWGPVTDQPDLKIEVHNVYVYPSLERLVLGIDVSIDAPKRVLDVSGVIYLIGAPSFDNTSHVAQVNNFDFTRRSDNEVVNLATSVLRLPPILSRIQKTLQYDFSKQYEDALSRTNAVLNSDLGNGVRLAGKMSTVNAGPISLLKDELSLELHMSGEVSIQVGL
jgi:hypothetical protein